MRFLSKVMGIGSWLQTAFATVFLAVPDYVTVMGSPGALPSHPNVSLENARNNPKPRKGMRKPLSRSLGSPSPPIAWRFRFSYNIPGPV